MFNLIEEVKDAATIGIGGHVRPDGDCVGSTVALLLFLQKRFPEKRVDLFLEKYPDVFRDLKGTEQIRTDFQTEVETYDVFFCVDCAAERLGDARKYFDQAKKTINIDHHISNSGCGMINFVVPTASSSSELVYELLEGEELNVDIARAIYTGIIHDTGVFQYSCTSPHTMEIGAKLIGYGFDFSKLIAETFYEKTYLQTQILGRALLESIQFMDGHCTVSCVEQRTMEFYGVTSSDLDGIVNQLLNIKGVDCAVFMYQTGALQYKVSMRSNEKVNVAQIAQLFGGGGHVRAAGCTMTGTFHDCINNLSVHIEKQFMLGQQ